MSKEKEKYSPASRAIMLGISLFFAIATFAANASKPGVDIAYLLGNVCAPFVVALIGVGLAWLVAKDRFKRSFGDYFVLVAFIFTILELFSRISSVGR